MKILPPTEIGKAVSTIRHGGILLYPTDTIYGIGGDATQKGVVEKIYALKGRESHKPLSIILPDIPSIRKYCSVTASQQKILKKYLPGPYTFILKTKKKLPVTKTAKLGVRIPVYPSILRIVRMAGVPLITTSANRSGKKDAHVLSEVDSRIRMEADYLLDGGKTKHTQGSTVVDLVDKKILRKGAGKFRF